MDWFGSPVTMSYEEMNMSSGNYSNGNDTIYLSFKGATIASPIIMFLCGLIGNVLALVILHRNRMESQRLMFHNLVAGLVWNDIIGIVLTSPVTIASYINGLQMPGGEHLCRFNGFVMICFGLSTPLIVSAMAIERFLFVKYTFFYTKHCAPSAARLIMVVIWGFVLFFGLLPMFGFGNYILQYPRTWCFLDFRTTNPVHAAYGYMYSCLNLMLVLIMVACNLVVVVTLARVRDYRRKYSTGSLNSVLIGDGIVDDSQRQQALVRRRKQKDIELQMIVVMCAITTIFAVCWVPLMVYISLTLATEGGTADVLGLVAIRLASLNQTLNPWLYVILRRALIIRVKKYCCRWRKYLRTKSHLSPAPVTRRHQYVHVRNQLCHRSNFVGAEVNNDSVSDSMRKSLHHGLPAAMSLPDVMMVNTGRRDLDMPLPDIAKAESYAGRVSHSYSLNNVLSCAYCNSPAEIGCVECLTERYAAARMASRPEIIKNRKYAVSEEYPKCPHNSKISQEHGELNMSKDKIKYLKKEGAVSDDSELKTMENQKNQKNQNKTCSEKDSSGDISNISRDALVCSKHSSHSKHVLKDSSISKHVGKESDLPNTDSKSGGSQKGKEKELFSMTSSSVRGSSLRGWSLESRLSQHMHKTRSNSKSSSSKTSSSKSRQRQQSLSGDAQAQNAATTTTSERNQARTENTKSDHTHQEDYTEQTLDDSRDSDNVFNDGTETTCFEIRKDATTTDDIGFSSMRTDSFYLSDTSTPSPVVQKLKDNHQKFVNKPANSHNPNHIGNKLDSNHSPIERQEKIQNNKQNGVEKVPETIARDDRVSGQTLQIPKASLPRLLTTKKLDQNTAACPSYTKPMFNVNLSGSNSCLLKEESDNESERSSGIFSADSPAKSSIKDLPSQPKFQVKKDSQSEPFHEMTSVKKQAARRVKSHN